MSGRRLVRTACAVALCLVLVGAHGASAQQTSPNEDVYAFGDAPFFSSTSRLPLAAPLVGMAATPAGDGYWLLGRDGGVFSFDGASFHGSTGGMPVNRPIVGMARTPTGLGFWLVASDGGIFNFGDAGFFGSMGGRPLNGKRVVGIAARPTGLGYWMVDTGIVVPPPVAT